jgi:cell division protein FtsW (lipid II flippase)
LQAGKFIIKYLSGTQSFWKEKLSTGIISSKILILNGLYFAIFDYFIHQNYQPLNKLTMKRLTLKLSFSTLLTLFIMCFVQVVYGQDSSSTTTRTTTTTQEHTWYTQPWVWVVGGAVLILLLVALLRGNSSSAAAGRTDKVTYTKTSETDTNV